MICGKKNTKYKHLKSHTQRYAQYLKDNFLGKDISKVVNQVKNDFYSYVNDEWVKANDLEKQEKNIMCKLIISALYKNKYITN